MKRVIYFVVVCVFLLSVISAATTTQASLGTMRLGNDVELTQICSNSTSICDSCTITSVNLPNTTTIITNQTMTKRANDFVYNLSTGNITVVGEYKVRGFCSAGLEDIVWVYSFEVTNTGTNLSTSQGILYVIVFLISLFIFILSLIGAITIKWGDRMDDFGKVVDVNDLKYVKLFLWFWSYIMLIWLSSLMWSITYAYLNFSLAGNFFKTLFFMLIYAFFPVFVVFLVTAVIRIIHDKKIKEAISRNIPIR